MRGLEKSKHKFGFDLFAYCLMPNHLHLLLRVLQNPVWKVMHSVLMRYAKAFNRRRGVRGHLFEDNYYPVLCERDEQFMEMVRYIHLNPVRAGLAGMPGDWRWSSWAALAEGVPDPLIDEAFVLGIFGTETERARAELRRFVLSGMARPREEERIYAPGLRAPWMGTA